MNLLPRLSHSQSRTSHCIISDPRQTWLFVGAETKMKLRVLASETPGVLTQVQAPPLTHLWQWNQNLRVQGLGICVFVSIPDGYNVH